MSTPVFLRSGSERVIHSGSMWHLMEHELPGGIKCSAWRPGHLFVTDTRLGWWYQSDKRVALDISTDRIVHVDTKLGNLGRRQRKSRTLVISYTDGNRNGDRVACFFGDRERMVEWQELIGEIIDNGRR